MKDFERYVGELTHEETIALLRQLIVNLNPVDIAPVLKEEMNKMDYEELVDHLEVDSEDEPNPNEDEDDIR